MPKFSYRAVDENNRLHEGELEAADRVAAITAIADRNWRPINISAAGAVKKGEIPLPEFLKNKKIKSDDIVMFTRQLSAMVGAGVPLLRALSSLEEHSDSPALKEVVGQIFKDVQAGTALADALAKHPENFSDVYVNMVRAGEAAGILDDILKRIAIQQEKNATVRKKIKSAMTYPMVLIVITIGAFFGLMLFVIPQIGSILQDLGGPDTELPPLTKIMLAISGFITSYWYLVFPALAGLVIALLRYIKTPVGRAKFHRLVLKMPAVKTIVVKVAVARFARTFSALMGAGVAVLEALDVTAHAIGNVVYEEALKAAAEEVKNGAALSSVIDQNDIFPPIVAQMLAVGEETGQTDTVLVKVADFYEEEVDVAIDGLSSIIEPIMIVFMGGMVGLIAASVMQPIAGLSQSIQA